MNEVKVIIEAEVNPTETAEKVKIAVTNIFGAIPTTMAPLNIGSKIIAEAGGINILANFRDSLRRDQVRAAARKVFFAGLRENTIFFCLNKQAAFANHVSFSQEIGESPLGPIRVTIKCQNPSELIDWLAPRTS